MTNSESVIEQIAKDFNLNVIYLDRIEHKFENVVENCYIAGNEIFIGIYKDEEKKLISFFHELGHKEISWAFKKAFKLNTLLIEIECWRCGIELARSYGIFFSDNAIKFGYEKALTYTGHDERERSSFNADYLWINQI